ncbi:hypothetical protein BASA50_002666 [Batrachochytrium salamandrivorans]|uniref:non-specific serine/threonine protein kinase n=1 Tax=Batrachochytrium salamandrivorans TaxID=1357716 RepID=A0ABQ8EX22_9FUNG|nr:hypothetical protein BASA62_008808 [Batrachochytrium salamandrivorans]KAH6588020.1 hypothetical protein BASA50_010884 [Batrachochytrium salamandrivorans]KAH6599982.1 hypothetical protein BASA50_002666 [Batrachochytrium salamandrivorans]
MALTPSDFSTSIQGRLEQLSQYISTENNQPSLSLEVLLDAFLAVYIDCKSASKTNDQISGFIRQYDQLVPKLQILRVNTRDFEIIKTLATGAVGRVCLVRAKKDAMVYAMKILKKSDLLTRSEAAFFMEERNALVFSEKSSWITTLYAAFQDEDNLYLVMEYVSGGSLRSLLNNRETSMEEKEARFYVAEMILALEVLHKYNYIHRDVKPENCLIDSSGHIKLADFGSCIRVNETSRVTSHETVGTPDYISPEILRAHEGNANYDQSVDWWSLGVILYELLFDEVPFYSESLVETYGKIMDHKKHFAFPDDIEISDVCKSFIQGLICSADVRLGRNGIGDIKNHPWFEGICWETIHESTAPFVPELSGPEDTRYFEDEENESKKFAKKPLDRNREFSGQNLAFVGYTYVKNATAQILWPGMGDQGIATNTVNLMVGQDQTTGFSRANSAANTAAYSIIKEQLDTETQKVLSLSADKKQAEDEAANLKASLNRESAQRLEMQALVSTLEKERNKLESEFKQLKLAQDRDHHNRSELEEKVTQLKESLNKEVKNSVETQELSEIRIRLEKEIGTLTAMLKDEKAQAVKREIGILELSKAKTMLDKETAKLSDALKLERQLKQDAIGQSDELNQKVVAGEKTISTLESEIKECELNVSRQIKEIASLKSTLKADSEKLLLASARTAELEKKNALLLIEVDSLQAKLGEARVREDELIATARDQQSTRSETASHEIDGLRSQLSVQVAARTKVTDELAQLSKAKALIEMEYADTKAKYSTEVQLHQETQKSLSLLQETAEESSRQISALENSSRKAQAQNGVAVFNSAALAAQVSLLQKQIEALEETNSGLHVENDTVRTELGIMSLELQNSHHANDKLQAKIAELEATCSAELKARINIESLRANLHKENAQLLQESERFRSRIDVITHEHENTISEHHGAIVQLRSEFKELEEKLTMEREQRFQMEYSQTMMTRKTQELEENGKRETALRMQAEKSLDSANKRVRELGSELETELEREQQLHQRINDLETVSDALKCKLEMADELMRERDREKDQLLVIDTKNRVEEKTPTRFKIRGMFFKGSRDSTEITPDRSVQKLQDPEEDGRNNKDADHRRKQSHQSMDSLASSLKLQLPLNSKIPELTTQDLFNPGDVLRGWLKIPKGGKVKKGWKLQFAIVRELKIYIYEREQDVDSLPGTQIIDIMSDIFLAKAVSQNEVIHANGRDIDLIFKIQAWTSGGTMSEESETYEIQQRVQKLQIDIELEVKMQKAAEKILSVTTDAQKVTVISQMDSSNKRLRALKAELEKLTPIVSRSIDQANESLSSSKESLENGSLVAESISSKCMDECQSLRKELEAQLEDETKKRDALHKLAYSDHRKKQKDVKDVEVELLTTDRVIAKIKESLETLSSGDREKTDSLLQRMRKLSKTTDLMGHFFTSRQYYKPTDCSMCHEALWDTKNQGLECTACKMICHKTCKPHIDTSCQDIIKLQSVAPMYFLAKDIQDRARWLVGLTYLRKEYELSHRPHDGATSTPEKRMSSFMEQVNSKRMSGIFSAQGTLTSRKDTIKERS